MGIEFTGGTLLEYKLGEEYSVEQLLSTFKALGIENVHLEQVDKKIFLLRTANLSEEMRVRIKDVLQEKYSQVEELRYEKIGPAIAPEVVKKTIYALLLASLGIIIWVSLQFRDIKFGVSALIAMLHDSFILVGSFSLFGHFWGAEVDFLFITALLTTLSFSVHDTIVVYDRIREKSYKQDLEIVANSALTETMVRSLNNSLTIVFMLIALILLGGQTIKWFAVALLVGTLLGTYSSPFVAVPILVIWEGLIKRRLKR